MRMRTIGLTEFDAIYLGAIGGADRPDHISAGDMILSSPAAVRSVCQPAADAAACRGLPHRWRTATPPTSTWCACARTRRARYAGVGGRASRGTPHELAEQTAIFTQHGDRANRPLRVRGRRASVRASSSPARRSRTRSVTRMVFWDEVADDVSEGLSDGRTTASITSTPSRRAWSHTRDARRHRRVESVRRHPDRPRRRRSPAASASRRAPTSIPSARYPSMFEPIHGSAPGHRRQGHRQPDRRDLGRCADARSPRSPGPARSHCRARSSASSPAARIGRRFGCGKAKTSELARLNSRNLSEAYVMQNAKCRMPNGLLGTAFCGYPRFDDDLALNTMDPRIATSCLASSVPTRRPVGG